LPASDLLRDRERLAAAVTSAARKYPGDPFALLRMAQLFGDLADNNRLRDEYLRILTKIHSLGAARTLDYLNEESTRP